MTPWVHPLEEERLSHQTSEVLRRLRMGPATNRELAALALKYTSRISDLRDEGYDVQVVERDRKTGRVVYALA